jgi:hypothetical protein
LAQYLQTTALIVIFGVQIMSFKKLLVVASMVFAPLSQAAYVTINEAGMDAVFSQAAFGNNVIDIRIGAVTQLVRPDLLNINSDAQINDLFSQHVGAGNVVNFYFIDTIQNSCGVVGTGVIGCGEFPGNDFLVESVFADDNSVPGGGSITVGVQLLSHELGHNLGLDHNSGNFLMNPFINGFANLTAGEVATILASPLVQTDERGRFILINPVLLVAGETGNGVPEPSSLALVAVGMLAFSQRRKLRALAA